MGGVGVGNERLADLTKRGLAALEFAKRLIARREHSAFELRHKLLRKGLAGEEDAVIASLSFSGLLDDERFSHAWVAARIARKGEGRRRLVAELIERGVACAVAEKVVDAELPREKERGLLEARAVMLEAHGYEPAAIQRRLLARGFPPAAVRRITESGVGSQASTTE